MSEPHPFRYDSAVKPEEVRHIRYEMGRAHRFQPALIDRAIDGVESVLAEYGVLPDTGGLVEMAYEQPLVDEGDVICPSPTTSNPANAASTHRSPASSSASSRTPSPRRGIRCVTSSASTPRPSRR